MLRPDSPFPPVCSVQPPLIPKLGLIHPKLGPVGLFPLWVSQPTAHRLVATSRAIL